MPSGTAAARSAAKVGERWSTATSKPNSSSSARHFSGPPAMPTARAPLILAIWPDGRPDRAGRGRHHDGLARLRLADLQQAGVRREAGHAEHAERRREAPTDGSSLRSPEPSLTRMGLPAGVGQDVVAVGVVGVARLLHDADRAADEHVTDLDRRGVGPRGAHPAAHVGVQGEVDDAQQQLPLGGRRHLVVGDAKQLVVRARPRDGGRAGPGWRRS